MVGAWWHRAAMQAPPYGPPPGAAAASVESPSRRVAAVRTTRQYSARVKSFLAHWNFRSKQIDAWTVEKRCLRRSTERTWIIDSLCSLIKTPFVFWKFWKETSSATKIIVYLSSFVRWQLKQLFKFELSFVSQYLVVVQRLCSALSMGCADGDVVLSCAGGAGRRTLGPANLMLLQSEGRGSAMEEDCSARPCATDFSIAAIMARDRQERRERRRHRDPREDTLTPLGSYNIRFRLAYGCICETSSFYNLTRNFLALQ